MNKIKKVIRKTADDYSTEYNHLVEKISSVEVGVIDRLMFLCNTYPDIIVMIKDDEQYNKTPIKAKTINSKTYINTLDISIQIKLIKGIENELKKKEIFIQGELF